MRLASTIQKLNLLRIIRPLARLGLFNWIPDEIYLQAVFFCSLGYRLNLKNPITFNEKLQWLKLNDKREEMCLYVDKLRARELVEKEIGPEYLIPLLGVYKAIEEISWEQLPKQFVIKCTHGCGCNIICRDKDNFDVEKAKKKLRKWLRRNWYGYGREWPYKHLQPMIIIEKFMQENITDYKFMCFHGEPKLIQVHQNRNTPNYTLDFYDANWERSTIKRRNKAPGKEIQKPLCLTEMLDIARRLSRNDLHVRIDLYEVNGRVYFGEKTYYAASGFSPFADYEDDKLLGSWIRLPSE